MVSFCGWILRRARVYCAAYAIAESSLNIDKVISALNEAKAPFRGLDNSIAEIIGWKKIYGSTTTNGETKKTVSWIDPTGARVRKPPYFTSNIDDAASLAQTVAPDIPVACSWHPEGGSAVIEGEQRVDAASMELALCVAALNHYKNRP